MRSRLAAAIVTAALSAALPAIAAPAQTLAVTAQWPGPDGG